MYKAHCAVIFAIAQLSCFVCFICSFGCYVVSFVVVHIYRTMLTICSSHIRACSTFCNVIVLCAYIRLICAQLKDLSISYSIYFSLFSTVFIIVSYLWTKDSHKHTQTDDAVFCEGRDEDWSDDWPCLFRRSQWRPSSRPRLVVRVGRTALARSERSCSCEDCSEVASRSVLDPAYQVPLWSIIYTDY